jgi:hypothetical protein
MNIFFSIRQPDYPPPPVKGPSAAGRAWWLMAGLLLTVIVLCMPRLAGAQDTGSAWQGTRPRGEFLGDTTKIGYPVQYALSLKHPADMEVIFPDSNHTFAPFEWIGKQYFPTRTDESGSTDSVVYTLATFQLDSVQTLSLPIYIIHASDCTAVYAPRDTIRIQHVLTAAADTASHALRVNTHYQTIPKQFNYPYVLIGLALAGLLGLGIFAFFGARIKRQYTLLQMSREHAVFSSSFDRITRRMRQDNSVTNVEKAVVLWKKYMESLEDKPYSTYTTKEIIAELPSRQLAEALQNTDRIIYGQIESNESIHFTRVLANVARRAYVERKTALEGRRKTQV